MSLFWLWPAVVGGSDSTDTPTTPTTPTENPVVKLPTVTKQEAPKELYTTDADVPTDTLVLSLTDQRDIVSTATKSAAGKTFDAGSPYAGYSLYTWNGAGCTALAETPVQNRPGDWNNTTRIPDATDSYGGIWNLKINPADATGCVNAIVRVPKPTGGFASQSSNLKLYTTKRQQAVLKGGTLYNTRAEAFNTLPEATIISGASAHLIDAKTILWEGGQECRLCQPLFCREW